MGIVEILGWIGLSIVKFIITPSTMIAAGNSFLYTWGITSIGAGIGYLLFYFGGNSLFAYFKKNKKKEVKITAKKIKRIRFILKNGMFGLFLISPIASVWLTGILAARFFGDNRLAIPIFVLGFSFWSLVLTAISFGVKSAV